MYFESDRPDIPYSLASLPEYAGQYTFGQLHIPHEAVAWNNLNPAPGSVDLIEPRSAHGQIGINDTRIVNGPVRVDTRENFNANTWVNEFNSNPQGPVSGGDDYNTGRLLAYEASQIQALTGAESAAATAYAG